MTPLRVGLIGCGGIAVGAHLPALARLSDRLRLVATADVDAESASRAASPWGAESYTDHRQLLDRSDVDMVVIATPEFLHREQVEDAAAAGKDVLCEKPMAPTLVDADAMLAACASAGVRLMIGHSRRFTRRYLRTRAALDRGEVGEVRLFRENERRARPALTETTSAGAAPRTYWTGGHWTGDPSRSVGAVLTNGIHEADLMRWFTGSEPVAVAAEHKVTVPGSQVPDFITWTVQFAGGAVGSTEVSNCAPPGYPGFHQLELYGTEGAIRARDSESVGVIEYDDTGARFPRSREVLLHELDAYVGEHAAFAAALREDRPVPLPPEDSRAALRLALAADEAARAGTTIRLMPAGGGGSV